MKLAQLGFVVRRVRNNLWELPWTHVLTAATMATTLFVFGAFMLLQENLQNLLKGWGEQIQINAYLDKSLDAADVQRLLARVRTFPEVEGVRHISQEQPGGTSKPLWEPSRVCSRGFRRMFCRHHSKLRSGKISAMDR